MRIVIDARPLSHPQVGGFRTYVRSLVQGLAEIGRDGSSDEIVLYVDRPLPPEAPALSPNMQVRVLDRRRLRTDLVLFSQQLQRDKPDLVHGTTNCLPLGLGRVPKTVTIHDVMQLRRYPFVPIEKKLRGRLLGVYEACLTRATAKRACRIVTVSTASAGEIASTLDLPPEHIRVVHNGLFPRGASPSAAASQREENTVLALASTDPRKNFDLLFRAVAEHQARFSLPPRLEIVCTNATTMSYVEQAARLHGLRREAFRLLRSPSDDALADCYARATVFVWPSHFEGFGLPPLEAMALGCPVVSSTAPAMPEVLGDSPVWFDPRCPDMLATVLGTLLGDPARQRDLSVRGRAHAAQFTCRAMAEKTCAVWREALAS